MRACAAMLMCAVVAVLARVGRMLLTRRGVLVTAGTALSLFALTVTFYRNPFDPLDSGRTPVSGEYIGQTKESILGRFGPPSREWEGHYGNPPLHYTNVHSPSITTLYIRSTGILYLSFEQVKGEWVCFSSDWMPNGVEF